MKGLIAAAVCAAATIALVPTAAPAAAVQTGKYDCYVFYSPGVPTFTGRSVKIRAHKRYSFYNGSAWKGGKYTRSGETLTFTSGPLKGKTALHKVYGDGTHGLDLRMASGPAGSYSCSHV